MEMARFVLQSATLPAVTQIRASDDYNPDGDANCTPPSCNPPVQSNTYYIGTTSLLACAGPRSLQGQLLVYADAAG